MWDNFSCWHHAEVGEVVTNPCPEALKNLFGQDGNISRNCTTNGWSDLYPSINSVCFSETKPNKESQDVLLLILKKHEEPGDVEKCRCSVQPRNLNVADEKNIMLSSLQHPKMSSSAISKDLAETIWTQQVFYMVVKTLYTLGHSLSLIALLTGSAILCLFRKLHCTRNYIHLNLFFSFILRSVAVLTKDAILFSHSENTQCDKQPSLIGCKASLVSFHYFIMANFFWLLVEGLYLHTLLMVIFFRNHHFLIYLFIGWGFPTVFVTAWIICRIYLENTGCWERNEATIPWRVIDWPVMASVIINFILFINIIQILVQKLRCPDVGGNDQSQYMRLAKSTLLLIPLFGVNYVVFVYMREESQSDIFKDYKIFFDLGFGSFQVQNELKRKWRSVCLKRYIGRDYRLRSSSISRNGTDNVSLFLCNSRTQSFLQTTETTV
ncbi:vasoactive intestinal polypeptide receptor 2 precursor [Silurus meridionalis]|nr:vasoactive intestinal polypeptide receptor 2 precursor [Silurus meridionalis]